ncbi:MAG: hypothetical protein H6597_04695 [Flavobacteriales bacterium]|nr:hypothetical protein [Flavobacteriales bacterium]MCB9193812.1 hypothetical protein [Flavobacteriales bacterium]
MKTQIFSGYGRQGAIVFIGAAMTLAACQSGPSAEELARDKDRALADNARLEAALHAKDSLIGAMALSFDDIEQNIALMDDQGKVLHANMDDLEKGGDKRDKILKDIQLMNGLLHESQDKVTKLQHELDRSNYKATDLRKKLEAIQSELATRDTALMRMGDLLARRDLTIEQVNQQLTAFQLDIAERGATITQLEKDINTAYMAKGTYKELEKQGVLTKEGGIVGIGKHVGLNTNAKPIAFAAVDVRELHTVPLNAHRVTLVTDHPAGSYELVRDAKDDVAALEIKDADRFWQLSKYLVVEVK